MKHEKEWYTCDRCGAEIADVDLQGWKYIFNPQKHILNKSEQMKIISQSPFGYVSEDIHNLSDNMCVTIIRGYSQNHKSIHLCGKCRKEFEVFMKYEH